MNLRRVSLMLAAAGLLFVIAACSSGDNPLTNASQGTVTVNIHDQTNPSIVEAWVTIDSLQLVSADGSVHSVDSGQLGQSFDLATLTNGSQLTLGSDLVPPGVYTELRMTVSALRIVLDDASEHDVVTPAAPVAVALPVALTVVPQVEIVVGVDFPLTAITFDGTNWQVDATALTID